MQRLVLAWVVAFALVAFAYAETNCESHRRNSQTSGHGLRWNIQCDDEGHYEPLQCTDDTDKKKWCACYNKEEAITSPSKKTRTCVCPLARDQAANEAVEGCDRPTCSNTGKYEPRQCCEDRCRCVDPATGEQRTDPERNPNLQCPST